MFFPSMKWQFNAIRFAALAVLTLAAFSPITSAAETFRFKPICQPTRAEVRIDASGELKLLVTAGTPDGGKAKDKFTRLPVTVAAKFAYENRAMPLGSDVCLARSVRKYESAVAKMHVGKGEIASSLAANKQTIVLHEGADRSDVFCPTLPLEHGELELLLTPFDSSLFTQLLPQHEVAVEESWEPNRDALCRLLRWDVVNQTDIAIKLLRVDEAKLAILSIEGEATGGVEGVPSEVHVSGKLNYQFTAQLCSWLAIDVKENRTPSQGAPGFEITTRIRTAQEVCPLPAALADSVVKKLKMQPDEATRLLHFAGAKQNLEFIYEPAWRVVTDQPNLAVLRLLDNGDMVAQCNISRLTPLGRGDQLTMAGFQVDLKRSLGTTLTEFVESGESHNENNVRVLRVVASAVVSEVPVHYVFLHMSDDQQSRASLAFTMDAEMAEQFGKAEETFVGSFAFTPASVGTSPSTVPAAKAEQAAKPNVTTKKK